MNNDKPNVENIMRSIAKIIAKKKEISLDSIKPDSTLESLDVDSLETFDVLFEVEHQYDIVFPKEFGEIKTLKDVATLTLNVIENK